MGRLSTAFVYIVAAFAFFLLFLQCFSLAVSNLQIVHEKIILLPSVRFTNSYNTIRSRFPKMFYFDAGSDIHRAISSPQSLSQHVTLLEIDKLPAILALDEIAKASDLADDCAFFFDIEGEINIAVIIFHAADACFLSHSFRVKD